MYAEDETSKFNIPLFQRLQRPGRKRDTVSLRSAYFASTYLVKDHHQAQFSQEE